MTRQAHNREALKELMRVNELIDLKIIRGENYNTEARRHRELVRMLRRSKITWGLQTILSSIKFF